MSTHSVMACKLTNTLYSPAVCEVSVTTEKMCCRISVKQVWQKLWAAWSCCSTFCRSWYKICIDNRQSSHNAHIHRRSMLAVVIMHVNKIEQDGKNKLHWKASQYHSVHLCQKKGIPRQQHCFVKTVRTVSSSVSEYKCSCILKFNTSVHTE